MNMTKSLTGWPSIRLERFLTLFAQNILTMMRKSIFLMLTMLTLQPMAQEKPPRVQMDTLPDIELREKVNNRAFQAGEYLKFRLHYGFVDAGEAEIRVKDTDREIFGRDVYHIVGEGKTLGAFNWFFKVRDKYETYLDKEGIFPWLFIRDVYEGGYEINQNYKFFQHKGAVKTQDGETYKVNPSVQDMLSAFYFARTLDFSDATPGKTYTIPSFVDGEEFPLIIKYLGTEVIKTRTGKYRCMKFVPVVQEGRIFKDEDDMRVWVTDDSNRIPILAKAKVLVGSIKAEVVDYSGLAHPVAKVD